MPPTPAALPRPRLEFRILCLSVVALLWLTGTGTGAPPPDLPAPRSESWQPASAPHQEIQSEVDETQRLITEALIWRGKAQEMFQELHGLMEQHVPLSHAQIERLHMGAESYLALRALLLKIVARRTWLANSAPHIRWQPGAGTRLPPTQGPTGGPFHQQTAAKQTLILDPTDAEGQATLVQLKLSLVAALVLYDNYIVGISPYFTNKHIRLLVDRDHPATAGKLQEITAHYVRLDNRRRLARALAVVMAEARWREQQPPKDWSEAQPFNGAAGYLDFMISQSPTFTYMVQHELGGGPGQMDLWESQFADGLLQTQKNATFLVSKFFGNGVGLISFRHGKMHALAEDQQQRIASRLQPLDILLEKTPFRLTDRFIPGYWGHVAIWMGTESELRELGVWEHPAVVPYQQAVREGRMVVEALRPGVQLNALGHFLNIDDLLVLRHQHLTTEQRREYLIRAMQQIGKEYDFNFDIETDQRIVCSELAYVVFHDIAWSHQKAMGRHTINPDHVAAQGLAGGALTPILLYHDGSEIPAHGAPGLPGVLQLLMEQRFTQLKIALANPKKTEPGQN